MPPCRLTERVRASTLNLPALGIAVDDEVDAKRNASSAAAFNSAEMKCTHNGANLSSQMIGPGPTIIPIGLKQIRNRGE